MGELLLNICDIGRLNQGGTVTVLPSRMTQFPVSQQSVENVPFTTIDKSGSNPY